MILKKVSNLVFDLGNVIIDIDFQLTYEAFARSTGMEIGLVKEIFDREKIFKRFETGTLTEAEFFDVVRASLSYDLSDNTIEEAWNALLLDIPFARIELIKKLRDKYNLFLLSNTNITHIRKVNEILEASSGLADLHGLFDKVYFSYEVGFCKPDKDIYDYVCRDRGLVPADTLLLDDMLPNLEGATACGWQGVQVTRPRSILELLKDA